MTQKKVPALIGGVMLVEAAAFAIGSLSHIPLKIGPLDEPKIVPAVIAEALCALALLVGGAAVLHGAQNAWSMAMGGEVVASLGTVLGIVALTAGRGPRTVTNDVFHYTVLTAMAVGIVALWRNEDRWRNQPEHQSVRTHNAAPNH
jgi:hypothetical protein